MQIALADASSIATRALRALGYDEADADRVCHHLLDCELRGLGYSGLARVLSIAERLDGQPPAASAANGITRETGFSAHLDGNDRVGYLVGEDATALAIEKAAQSGLGFVGASNPWFTGMLSYYAERITAAGYVAFIVSNATAWVAPAGGSEPLMGTNPICFGFPAQNVPFIWDIGISEVIHAQVVLAQREGRQLPDGVAFDAQGHATTNPAEALGGAFAAWGGHRGSGLGLSIQLLGAMVGAPLHPPQLAQFGMLVTAIDPELFGDAETFVGAVTELQDALSASRPLDPDHPVRAPFARSAEVRRTALERGEIDVPDRIVDAVRALGDRPHP